MKRTYLLAAAAATLTLAACEVTVKNPDAAEGGEQPTAEGQAPQGQQAAQARQAQQARMQAQQELRNLRFQVDISERQLQVFNGEQKMATHPVSVGTEKWPTPTGKFAFHQVDLNPEWIPPKDESWAEKEQPKAPGAADNPLGTVRLVYRMPNTVHGTYDLDSLGKAESHGSIRVANATAVQLAQLLLKAGGKYEGDPWFNQMVQNRTREFEIPLEQKIPIEVVE